MELLSIGGTYLVFRNRTGIGEGESAAPFYEIGHVGDDAVNYTTPNVTWLKDGEPVSTVPTDTPIGSNGGLRTTLSIIMTPSDEGVYQCVVTDTARSEVLVTAPIRLEISKTVTILKHCLIADCNYRSTITHAS